MSSAAPPYGAPPVAPRRRRGGVVGPLLLIFIGGVFLLQNTGYLPPNFWVNLWKLWPLVLVLIGIELLLSHRVPWVALAGVTAVVLVLGAVTLGMGVPSASNTVLSQPTSTTVVTDLGGANQAAVTVRFGAGELEVGPLDQPSPTALASMSYQGPPQLAPQPRYTVVSGGVGQLEYQSSAREGPPALPFVNAQASSAARMQLHLAPGVPISSLNVQTGATDAQLDLSSLRVATLDMSVGAATAWVRLPEAAGLTTAHISGGASTITLEVPQGVAAQIQHHGGLSTLNVDQSRFPEVNESMFRSPDYDAATNKVDLAIETGVTTITVH